MKSTNKIKGVELPEFDTDNMISMRELKLKNRRVQLGHDGKGYYLYWKHLDEKGAIHAQALTFTPEAMFGIVEMYINLGGPKPEGWVEE